MAYNFTHSSLTDSYKSWHLGNLDLVLSDEIGRLWRCFFKVRIIFMYFIIIANGKLLCLPTPIPKIGVVYVCINLYSTIIPLKCCTFLQVHWKYLYAWRCIYTLYTYNMLHSNHYRRVYNKYHIVIVDVIYQSII